MRTVQISDSSDAVFNVVGSTLKILYPNDGSTDYLHAGRAGQIRWSSFGDVQAVYALGGTVTFTVSVPTLPPGEFGAAREVLTAGSQSGPGDFWREAGTANGTANVNDTVSSWRWWPAPAGFTLDTSAHENTPPAERPAFMRGVMLPGWWSSQNPWSPLIGPTLDWMVKDARAGWVQLVGVAEITNLSPPTFSLAGAITIPNEEQVRLVGEAHARGLKVFFNPGEVSFLPDAPPQPAGETWWRAYAAQWRSILLRWAALAQANGVEMLGIGKQVVLTVRGANLQRRCGRGLRGRPRDRGV